MCIIVSSSRPLLFTQIQNVNNRERFRQHLACSSLARRFRGDSWPVKVAVSAEVQLWFCWSTAACENSWGLEEGRLKLMSDKICECKLISD